MFEDKKVILGIRVEKSVRDTFVNCCKGNDVTASQEIRKFMREYISKNQQQSLKLK